MSGTQSRDIKLLFLDLVDKFYPSEGDGCVSESFKPEHRSHSLFDATMVLFNGLITNDKFCFVRTGQITLRWTHGPRRNSPQAAVGEKGYLSEKSRSRGGAYEAPVANPPSLSGSRRRSTTLGPSVSTPTGVGASLGSQHRRSAPRSAAHPRPGGRP